MRIYLIRKRNINKNNWQASFNNILRRDYKIDNPILYHNEYGKPYLEDSNIFFNVSHSGNIIAISFADEEIGIDVEEIKPRKRIDNIVNKAFLEEEKKYYYNLDNDNKRIDYFYYIWTQKESYVKFLGVGIRGYFNNVKIGYNKNINTKKINIDNINYYLSICSNNIERKNIDIIYE